MSQPLFDNKINCLEQFKDEIISIPTTNASTFLLLNSNVYININKFKNWIISHNDY